jgi:hypothetical protein
MIRGFGNDGNALCRQSPVSKALMARKQRKAEKGRQTRDAIGITGR